GNLIPGAAVGVRRHRQILRPSHRGEEPRKTRTGLCGFEIREPTVFVVIGIDDMWIVRHGNWLFAQALIAGIGSSRKRSSLAPRKDVTAHDGLVTAGPDSDARNMGSGKLFQPQNVVARLGGQVVELAGAGYVLPPAGQLLVDRLRAGDIALGHRHVIDALAVDLIADADRDR